MSVHEKAWAGVRLLVVGGAPSAAMKLEQSIAAGVPAQEVLIDSFEGYSEALEYCKERRDVGLIFIHEESGGIDALDAFRSLIQPFEHTHGPGFGVLVRRGDETVRGHSALRFSRGRLLDYIDEVDLNNASNAKEIVTRIWNRYCDAFEEAVAPEAIRRVIAKLVEPVISHGAQLAIQRVSRLMAARLALSWREALAVRWAITIQALKTANPEFLSTQDLLLRLCGDLVEGEAPLIRSISEVLVGHTNLSRRLVSVLSVLNSCDTREKLEATIAEINSLAKPGSPGLNRQLAMVSDEIRKIFTEERFAPGIAEQERKVA